MKYTNSDNLRKRLTPFVFCAFVLVLCLGTLLSCSASIQSKESESRTYRLSGDAALPDLDGDYFYVLAEAISKNPDSNSIEIEVLPWEPEKSFKKSGIAVGERGVVSCSELVIFPAGIREGSIVVVSYLQAETDSFPITASSIEKLDLFEERVARWSGV